MEFIRILFPSAMWIIPIIIMTNIYLKMNKEEKEKFRAELKRPFVLFGLGFPVIGALLLFTGIISTTMKLLQHIGAIMVFISWFTTSIISWKTRKTGFVKSVALIVLGIIGVGGYSYLI